MVSQRLFSLVWIAAVWGLVALATFASGIVVVFGGTIEETLLKLAVPVFGTFLALRNWYGVLDAKIVEGSLDPGTIVKLFTLTPFYVMTAAAAAAAFALFGLQWISDATLTILIDGFVLLAQTLLESFAIRPPGSVLTTQAIIQAQVAQAAQSASPPLGRRATGVDGRP
jgi:hypothetical protein